jgi:hypothetical protein
MAGVEEAAPQVAEAFYDAVDAVKASNDTAEREAASKVISLTASSADPAGPVQAPQATADSVKAPVKKRSSFLNRLKGKGDKATAAPVQSGSQLAEAGSVEVTDMAEYVAEDGSIVT